ncbi:MAG: MFS transporter, partial [Nitrospirota bacterium]
MTKKSLRYSILDGTFSAAMIGFGESFFIAFAIFLKANNIQIGLLSSLPKTLGSLVQFFSDRLIDIFRSRKRIVTTAALLQALMYIPIALVYFFGTYRVYHLIIFVTLYWVCGMILDPAWNSWMGDLTTDRDRGHYFGRRNKITGFSTFITFSVAGLILQNISINETYEALGFSLIFLLALSSRIVSYLYLNKQYEPPYTRKAHDHFSFADFLRQARHRNFGLLVLYLGLMNFAVWISAP